MRKPHEPIQPSDFPTDLEFLWGQQVSVVADVFYRTVIEIPGTKSKTVKMPQLEIKNLHITGYDDVIPQAVVCSPAFWKSGLKMLDTVVFQGTLAKGKRNCIAFRGVKNVKNLHFVAGNNDSFEEVQPLGEAV